MVTIQDIKTKESELLELTSQYDNEMEAKKNKVLSSKGEPMHKSLYLIEQEFQSSSHRTEQYLEFHKTFKKEFSELLKSMGVTEIEVSKPNHFDVTGFFRYKGQAYYFSIGDLRWNKESMLIRTAKDFKDYTGGSNNSVDLDSNFAAYFKRYLEWEQ